MTISLPTDLLRDVELGVKQGGYATKSEYIRDLVRSWKQAKLLDELNVTREEFKKGKGIKLKSMRDLMK